MVTGVRKACMAQDVLCILPPTTHWREKRLTATNIVLQHVIGG